jgi:formate dehydrogenase iron-sulfur subunit
VENREKQEKMGSQEKIAARTTRRRFLNMLACLPAAAAMGVCGVADARPKQYGKLADTFRCIGCKRCMSACKRWNDLEVERDELISDRDTDLSGNNWVVVNLRSDVENRERRTYMHWACQHCDQPACAGVCPVSAITKLANGAVVINEKKCIGCRYCYQACPFKVPRFDFAKRVTRKCTLCYDRFPLNYKKPACVAACPVGALAFGYRDEIIREAKVRVDRLKRPAYIMGLTEAGGTGMITILPTRPENFGLVAAPAKVINHDLDKIRITATGIMGAALIAGAMQLYAHFTRGREPANHERDA